MLLNEGEVVLYHSLSDKFAVTVNRKMSQTKQRGDLIIKSSYFSYCRLVVEKS